MKKKYAECASVQVEISAWELMNIEQRVNHSIMTYGNKVLYCTLLPAEKLKKYNIYSMGKISLDVHYLCKRTSTIREENTIDR